jgi:hypothetical protein
VISLGSVVLQDPAHPLKLRYILNYMKKSTGSTRYICYWGR